MCLQSSLLCEVRVEVVGDRHDRPFAVDAVVYPAVQKWFDSVIDIGEATKLKVPYNRSILENHCNHLLSIILDCTDIETI
jgi:hypothetical protein